MTFSKHRIPGSAGVALMTDVGGLMLKLSVFGGSELLR